MWKWALIALKQIMTSVTNLKLCQTEHNAYFVSNIAKYEGNWTSEK